MDLARLHPRPLTVEATDLVAARHAGRWDTVADNLKEYLRTEAAPRRCRALVREVVPGAAGRNAGPDEWLNQVEIWFGLITKQAIRRGTFSSVSHLINDIRAYIEHWNTRAEPFLWTTAADEILAKLRVTQANVKKLVDSNAK